MTQPFQKKYLRHKIRIEQMGGDLMAMKKEVVNVL
jgi:hypothetical protein